MATRNKRLGRSKARFVFAGPAKPPRPGHWKLMQTHDGLALQYAWTCPTCKATEYVLVDPPRAMEKQPRREWCCQKECAKSKRSISEVVDYENSPG